MLQREKKITCPILMSGVRIFFCQSNGNLINLTCFGVKALVNKLCPLLYKRAELDLRLTKCLLQQIDNFPSPGGVQTK